MVSKSKTKRVKRASIANGSTVVDTSNPSLSFQIVSFSSTSLFLTIINIFEHLFYHTLYYTIIKIYILFHFLTSNLLSNLFQGVVLKIHRVTIRTVSWNGTTLATSMSCVDRTTTLKKLPSRTVVMI